MGVLYDYFRAPNRQVALRLLDEGDGVPSGPTTVGADIDALDAKGIDHIVILGQLIASILNVPWSVDLIGAVTVWPSEETKPASAQEADLQPDSPLEHRPVAGGAERQRPRCARRR